MDLYLEVNLDDVAGKDRGPLIRQWFDDMSPMLFTSLEGKVDVRWLAGMARNESDTMEYFDDSPQGCGAFARELLGGPAWAEASLETASDEQLARIRSFPTVFGDPRFLSLSAIVPCEDRKVNDEGFCSELATFIANAVAQLNPAFGRIEHGLGDVETNLDVGLGRIPSISVSGSRNTLRGYAWLVIVSAEILHRLGGAEGLESVGAFHRILPLPAGGAVLQASPTIAGYTDSVMEKVFRALTPVLPSGMPKKDPAYPRVRFAPLDASELWK